MSRSLEDKDKNSDPATVLSCLKISGNIPVYNHTVDGTNISTIAISKHFFLPFTVQCKIVAMNHNASNNKKKKCGSESE
jgi:hypothetical protein